MTHTIEIKVRGYHLDIFGHVNNARYLEFLEEARWTLLEETVPFDDWLERGVVFAVVRVEIDYLKPVTFGQTLAIESSVSRIGGSSAVIRQVCRIAGTDETAAAANVTFVIVERETGRVRKLEGELRDAVLAMAGGEEP